MNFRKIKICHIITTFEMGGAQLSTLRLLHELSKNTVFDLYLIYGEEGPLKENFLNIKNVSIFQVKELKRNINVINDIKTSLKIYKFFKKTSIDIVHTHCSKPSFFGRIAAIFQGIKCIHTYHGFGHDYYSNSINRYLFISIEKIINSFSSNIVFVCDENKKIADKLKLVSKKINSIIIHDILSFKKIDHKIFDSKRLKIISVLSFKEQKRPFDLLKIIYAISKKYPETEFTLVGEGPLLFECKQNAKLMGLKNINFTGAVMNIEDYYKNADIFIGCSKYEGLSMAELECLYYNIPMIITDAGGIKDFMIHGKQGYYYDYLDINEILLYCQKIILKEFKYIPINNVLLEKFNENYVYKEHEKLYYSMV